MTDFRALCVELTDCLEKADWPHRYKHVFEQWIYIARKALAEPEPIDPDKEKAAAAVERKLLPWLERDAVLAQIKQEGPTVMEIIELADEIEAAGLGQVDLVRTALARWGNHPESPDSSTQPS